MQPFLFMFTHSFFVCIAVSCQEYHLYFALHMYILCKTLQNLNLTICKCLNMMHKIRWVALNIIQSVIKTGKYYDIIPTDVPRDQIKWGIWIYTISFLCHVEYFLWSLKWQYNVWHQFALLLKMHWIPSVFSSSPSTYHQRQRLSLPISLCWRKEGFILIFRLRTAFYCITSTSVFKR